MSDSYQFSNVFVTNQSTSLEAAQRELASLLANGPLSASNFVVRPRPQVGVPRSWGAQKLSATLGQMHSGVNSGQMHTTHHNSSTSYDLVNRDLVVCASVTQTAILCICNINTESKMSSVAMRPNGFGRKGLENGTPLFPRMDPIERKLCNAANLYELAQDPA